MIEHHDYTTMRMGKRTTTRDNMGGTVGKCPVCGRKGIVASRVVAHSGTYDVQPFPLGGEHIKALAQDFCNVTDNSRHDWSKE